jgi:hypothetical protein
VGVPRRKLTTAQPPRSLLAFVEGKMTEEAYLLVWARHARVQTLVDIDPFRGTPMPLVERAVQAKNAEEREHRRRRGRAHDEYWCVFDVNAHPHIPEAIALARANGIRLAISNPCIELWFLLHFAEQTAYVDRRQASRLAKRYTAGGKGLTPDTLETLRESFDIARERAIRLEEKHRGDGTLAPGNPSSGVWRLVDSILGY